MSAIEERISDRHVLKLLRAMLRAGVMEDGAVRRREAGTPQGGVISPCLCSVYLHRLDRQWQTRGDGVLVRYADDLLTICTTKQEAEGALEALTAILAELGLELKTDKTRIVHLREGGEGVDFLGFHHRYVRGNTPRSRHLAFLVRSLTAGDGTSPPADSGNHRPLTAEGPHRGDRARPQPVHARLGGLLPIRELARQFTKIMLHAYRHLAGFIAKRHKQRKRYGYWVLAQTPDRFGVITLNGTIVAPRPNRPWRRGS